MTSGNTAQTNGAATGIVQRCRRLPDWLIALAVGLLTALIATIAQWRGHFFYYVGDQHEQFAPLWHVFGTSLRAGQWPTMDPAGWMGGNYAAEALTGIWNPVNLLNFMLVSHFDNLSLAAFVVMVEMLAILGAGVYLLAREYGSRRAAAVIVATALPVSGFTLWYEASGWPAGLMAFTWVTHFWWSARRHSRGAMNPFVPFLFGALAMTTGNPYAPLGLVVVLAAIAVELAVRRRYVRLAHLVVLGACVGAVALLVFLPLLGTSEVTTRESLAALSNDTFLVPDVGDLVTGSVPTYLPSMSTWAGGRLESVPTTYFAWFLVPLLPWLRWRTARARAGALTSLFGVGGFYLLATLAPSNLWLFRWPVRLVEYLYLAVGVLFAVALSAGLARDNVRRRAGATAALVVVGFYLGWAVRPDEFPVHALGLLVVAALLAALLVAYRRGGLPTAAVVAVVGTAAVLFMQASSFPASATDGGKSYPAYDLNRIAAGTADYRGTVLQIAALENTSSEDMRRGEILFGNLPRAAGIQSVASYTGMGFVDFAKELCMDYRGATCRDAFDRVWRPADASTPAPLIDVMGVSTLVLQRSLLPEAAAAEPPPGWHRAYDTPVRAVWIRDEVLPADSRLTWTSPGVEARTAEYAPQREAVHYTAAEPGRIAFARLAWPGYTATVDGRDVELAQGPAGLLAVDVPAGEHTLVVEFATPGLRLGFAALVGAVLAALVQTAVWFWRRPTRSPRRGGTARG
ncbi:hypothetical protein FK531_01820 [Rhodococcus spelaei]|uniref:YfhO family protein n=1 Tax=Rhodococcus spelaei TaxID=2546320 RepID=A0A541BR76_9NOCA|nr:hypothetical protein [Rhodococcus spelaei]TQF74842.1 hypothetical protein FK531_01820 [Rhodococcus spelaei]